MGRVLLHTFIVVFLTLLTQLGGLAWLIALCFRRRVLGFGASYLALWLGAFFTAPAFGREPISCLSGGNIKMQSVLYCALNRHYVTPELSDVLQDFSSSMEQAFPETKTLVLDANFPFITGFPLLPHLSHDDGGKVDLAFYYKDDGGFLPGVTRSPIGYFAFEDGPTQCADTTLTLRWNMTWLQGLWPAYQLEPRRMMAALQFLSDDPRVSKVFIEPHLKSRFQADADKIRFQGCRAARHDDHIHLQL